MAVTQEFKDAYSKLNISQKKAVDTIDGPVMVIAGPGTGKTQILALRIGNILIKTDTAPDSILALTFTESGVYSMRKRLVSIIGNAAYKVNIYTFHGFCNDVIKNYPEEFSRIIGSNSATEIDQIRILEEIIEGSTLEYLKPYGDVFYYVRPVLGMIRNLKREDISPEAFKKIIKQQEQDFKAIPDLYHEKGAHKGKMKGEYADLEKKIEKNKELLKLYEAYEQALEKNKIYDYEDMIVEVVTTLKKNQDLLLRLQEKYQYVLADEHQDANRSQNEILELLSNFHDNPNIFVVGDEKQAIFRFQGASLENFLYFKKIYPRAEIISLEENYRSIQHILDVSHTLIGHNKIHDEALRKKLRAGADHAKKSRDSSAGSLYEFTEHHCELQFVAEDIQQKIQSGVSPREIAVIYRNNRDAEPLVRTFEKTGVPFMLQSDQDVFSDADIAKLIIIFRTIWNLGSDELLIQLLYVDFLKLEPLDVYKLASCAAKKRISLFDAYRSEECLQDAEVEDKEKFLALAQKLSSWCTVAKNKTLLQAFEIIAHESGFLQHILALPDSQEKLAKLDVVFEEAKKIAETNKSSTLGDLLKYIDILKKYSILVKTGLVGEERESVRLMTAHKSKGLEFEHVYIIGLTDGHWGNKREIRHFHIPILGLQSVGIDPMEDERRLLYVALTRAKKHITLTYSVRGEHGENLLPSQFLVELDPILIQKKDTQDIEKKLREHPAKKYAVAEKKPVALKDKEFLKNLFLSQGLSVTALNKYLSCPWDYFFNNLLRIPSAETKHQLYGTAVHATLKEFFTAYAREEDMPKATLLKIFEQHLSTKYFSAQDFTESLEKGRDALSGYYDAYNPSWPRNLLTEYTITQVPITFKLDEKEETIMVRGVLDKVEFVGAESEVNVVDYKTAKPKSRNAIMGLTKTESGDYFRQLCFYKLLLEKNESKKYKMLSGEIDFIEPDDKGKYHKEKFEISQEDTQKLEELIVKTAQEICSLDFWNKRCDERECTWCAIRNLISDSD